MIDTQGNGCAIVYFKNIVSAFLAQQSLNQVTINALSSRIIIKWYIKSDETEEKHKIREISEISESLEIVQKEGKYTCRFDIQIENDKEFQVAKRIIGSKGINMKKIIEACNGGEDGKELVKLRLRGHGSGFKEGPLKLGILLIRIGRSTSSLFKL